MHQSANRNAVTKVIEEVLLLRQWTRNDVYGVAIPGEAFGTGVARWQESDCSKANDYLFTITHGGGAVLLEIDAYTARRGDELTTDNFDVEAWESEAVVLTAAPPCRNAYRLLHRTARMLLAGFDVRLPGLALLKGIHKAGG